MSTILAMTSVAGRSPDPQRGGAMRARWTPHDRVDHIVENAYEHAACARRSPAANRGTDDRRDCAFASASLPLPCLLAWLILSRVGESRHNQRLGPKQQSGNRAVATGVLEEVFDHASDLALLVKDRAGRYGTVWGGQGLPDLAARVSPKAKAAKHVGWFRPFARGTFRMLAGNQLAPCKPRISERPRRAAFGRG